MSIHVASMLVGLSSSSSIRQDVAPPISSLPSSIVLGGISTDSSGVSLTKYQGVELSPWPEPVGGVRTMILS